MRWYLIVLTKGFRSVQWLINLLAPDSCCIEHTECFLRQTVPAQLAEHQVHDQTDPRDQSRPLPDTLQRHPAGQHLPQTVLALLVILSSVYETWGGGGGGGVPH